MLSSLLTVTTEGSTQAPAGSGDVVGWDTRRISPIVRKLMIQALLDRETAEEAFTAITRTRAGPLVISGATATGGAAKEAARTVLTHTRRQYAAPTPTPTTTATTTANTSTTTTTTTRTKARTALPLHAPGASGERKTKTKTNY